MGNRTLHNIDPCKLPADLQVKFDALTRTRGPEGASRILGTSVMTIDRLTGGGCATTRTVARVAEKLRELQEAS